jgi:hypothetical protein
MTDNDLELLSAYFDGDRVDPRRLVDVLENPDAIDVLRDFAKVRAEVMVEALPREAWVRQTRARLDALGGGSLWRRWVPIPAPALVAAAVVIAAIGVWTLRPSMPVHPEDKPPVPTRVVAFVEGQDWGRI